MQHRLIDSAVIGILATLICMLTTLSRGIEFGASLESGFGVFLLVIIIEALIHFWRFIFKTSCHVLDQQVEDDPALWQAFRRFLDDFTTFENKELPEFSVWREYMVYAVAMGHGLKVAYALALKYPEAFSTGTDTFDDNIYHMLQNTALYDAMDSIGQEVADIKEPSSSSDGDGSDSGSGGDFMIKRKQAYEYLISAANTEGE